MKKTRLVALGLGALSLAGLVGAGVGLSANNNVRADEVKAEDELAAGIFLPRSGEAYDASKDENKMYYDASGSSDKFGYFYYKTVNFSVNEQFKIADKEHFGDNGTWINNIFPLVEGFSVEGSNNIVCTSGGQYTITYWYGNSENRGIWNIVEGDVYTSPTSSAKNYVYFISTKASDEIKLYTFDNKTLGEWSGTTLSDINDLVTLDFKYSDKNVYCVPKTALDGATYMIANNGNGTQSNNTWIDLGRVYEITEKYQIDSLAGDGSYYDNASLSATFDLIKSIDDEMDRYDSPTFSTTFSKSVCAIGEDTAKSLLKKYANIRNTSYIGNLTLNTFVKDDVNDNYNAGSTGEVSLSDIIEKLHVFSEGQKNTNVINPQKNVDVQPIAVAVSCASIGTLTAGGFLLIRKRKMM